MSIIQALIGSIVSSGSGGGGGGTSYPGTGVNYVAQGAGGFSLAGTAYDPGGAVDGIYAASTGWRRVTTAGTWSVGGNNDYPGIFGSEDQVDIDAYGGFGYTNLDASSYYAMEWKGYIKAVAGSYHTFYTTSDDVCMFWIGNAALNPTQQNAYVISNGGTTYPTNSLLLTADKWYPVRMRFQEWDGAESCQVFYASEGGTAYGMLNYFNADRLRYNGYTNNYGSTNSLILNLGNATTNVFSGSGDWLDSSPALNNAELYGESTLPTWLPSDSGGVWQLDGTQWFNVPTLRYYNDQEMTASIWFNIPTDTSVTQTLISKELTFKIRINPGGQLQVFAGNGGGWTLNQTINGAYTYGEWTNITLVVTSGQAYVYKNGQQLNYYAGVVMYSGDSYQFQIGSYSSFGGGSAGDRMTGKIGEVKYFTGAKSAQDVIDEYNATVARYNPPSPTYTLTPDANNVDEGSTLTFNVTGSNIVNGTYYWTLETNAGDFSANNGLVTITGNTGSFTVTPDADDSTDGSETFTVSLRADSIAGDILATSDPITINDTSLTPVTLTSGTALSFNGVDNQRVVISDNQSDWDLGDTWTIEWWQKVIEGSEGFLSILSLDSNVAPYAGIDIFINNGSIQMANGNFNFSEAAATRGQWNHIAIQKNGTDPVPAAYINGVAQSVSGSFNRTIISSSPLNLVIGSRTPDGGVNFFDQYFHGQLANIRISNISRYSATFMPPTGVVNDAYTLLAIDGSNGGGGMLVDETARHTLTNIGAVEDAIGTLPADITGSLTIGNGFSNLYGYSPGVPQMFISGHGSLTQNPAGIISGINYSPTNDETVIVFVTGTYTGANGELVVTDGETINSSTTYTVKIGSITQTMSATIATDTRVIIYGADPFNLVAQNGQTVAVEITVG